MATFLLPFLFLCTALAGFLSGLHHLAPIISKHFLLEHSKSIFYFPYHAKRFAPYEIPLLRTIALISLACMTLILGCVLFASSSHLLTDERYFDFALDITFFSLIFLFILGTLDAIAARYAKKLLLICGPIVSPIFFVIYYLTYPYLKWQHKAHALDDEAPDPQNHMEEILEAFQDPSSTQSIEPSECKLIESALSLKDTRVREVMIPRVNLFCLEASLPIAEAAKIVSEEGYSRVPIYRKDLDTICGILMVKDLVAIFAKKEAGELPPNALQQPIETLVKRPLYTPESKYISQLLQEFRMKQTHLAIVVDEYGGTKGVVSIEDILEELVGEIEDEYDAEDESPYTPLPSGGWLVSATMSIADLDEQLSVHIPYRDEYDTLGGYIFHRSGKIPKQGFTLQSDEYTFEIISSDDRKIDKIKITPVKH